mmetsp:Transcript_42677/g.117765  ORF Transcript_42677/g.117765 Transcript_42677/m.117765 type:complete len:259 (-) Transcript_42677:1949-2725(-)
MPQTAHRCGGLGTSALGNLQHLDIAALPPPRGGRVRAVSSDVAAQAMPHRGPGASPHLFRPPERACAQRCLALVSMGAFSHCAAPWGRLGVGGWRMRRRKLRADPACYAGVQLVAIAVAGRACVPPRRASPATCPFRRRRYRRRTQAPAPALDLPPPRAHPRSSRPLRQQGPALAHGHVTRHDAIHGWRRRACLRCHGRGRGRRIAHQSERGSHRLDGAGGVGRFHIEHRKSLAEVMEGAVLGHRAEEFAVRQCHGLV